MSVVLVAQSYGLRGEPYVLLISFIECNVLFNICLVVAFTLTVILHPTCFFLIDVGLALWLTSSAILEVTLEVLH